MIHEFSERLEFSKGARKTSDVETIRSLLPGCVSVLQSSVEMDKRGVDYIATLRRGAEVLIDAKAREKGCSRYWRGEPEVAIEIWSVMPTGKYGKREGKAGWTFDESKITDAILYTYDPIDCDTAYFFPFQHLRMAAIRNISEWIKKFGSKTQDSGYWQSSAVFVPVGIVIEAIQSTYVVSQFIGTKSNG
jgi:hypothetical protein